MTVIHGDCLAVMAAMEPGSVDAVVTDPPYGLKFMGKDWDHGLPGVHFWQEALTVLRPSSYLLAFGGTRTWHRLACALEDAGFEIRDTLMWMYGQGFPKGKACLKPAWEPVILARKPGPMRELGIEECRIDTPVDSYASPGNGLGHTAIYGEWGGAYEGPSERHPESIRHHAPGRWPANVVLDEEAAAMVDEQTGWLHDRGNYTPGVWANDAVWQGPSRPIPDGRSRGDSGGASRFFYCAKASRAERGDENGHPTVKPVALMRWLVRLVAREGDLVLDPFTGSGTTGVACAEEGRSFIGIEREAEYVAIAERRIAAAAEQERLPV